LRWLVTRFAIRLLGETADVGAGGRDVEERALDGGDAEAVALRDLIRGEGEAVEAQLRLVPAVRRNGQIDRHDALEQPAGHEGARVTEPGVVSAGEQGRPEASPHRERAEGVHVAVDQSVPPGLQSVRDRIFAEAGGEQL
jgi:hypothetical protein